MTTVLKIFLSLLCTLMLTLSMWQTLRLYSDLYLSPWAESKLVIYCNSKAKVYNHNTYLFDGYSIGECRNHDINTYKYNLFIRHSDGKVFTDLKELLDEK